MENVRFEVLWDKTGIRLQSACVIIDGEKHELPVAGIKIDHQAGQPGLVSINIHSNRVFFSYEE
jgi:hypothetical protein